MKYNAKNNFWSKLASCVIGGVIAICLGVIVLMPYGYMAKEMNKDGSKPYLVNGYRYTLNGVIPETVFDWVVHN